MGKKCIICCPNEQKAMAKLEEIIKSKGAPKRTNFPRIFVWEDETWVIMLNAERIRGEAPAKVWIDINYDSDTMENKIFPYCTYCEEIKYF